MISALSGPDKKRLSECIETGIKVKSDIEALRDSMKDVVDTVAEDLDIPKRVLNKAINIAYKELMQGGEIDKQNEELSAVEEVLVAAGRL